MDRYLVISSDGHAGPHAADYRDYLDPEWQRRYGSNLPPHVLAAIERAG